MKVAFIITRSDTIGGAHIHVKDLAESLSTSGHNVKVFVGQCGKFTEVLRLAGIPFHSLQYMRREISPLNDIKALLELKCSLQSFQPDLVACHSSKAGLLGRIAARTCGFPAVFTAHGWAFTEGVPAMRRKIYRLAEFLVAPLTRKIITVSEEDRRLAIKYAVAAPDKLVTVLNGIPDTGGIRTFKQISDVVKIVVVARLDTQKNHADLLRALSMLNNSCWHLDIVGDGPLEKVLRNMTVSLGIDKRVSFLGYQDNVQPILSDAQIFVLISNWEGLPLSILEAMQAGLPVVASDIGGVREALRDKVTGYLISPGDILNLSRRLEDLLMDDDLRGKMGRAGRQRYEECFTLKRMVRETLVVYRGILEEAD